MIITNVIARYVKNNSLNQKPSRSLNLFENPKTSKVDIINKNYENRFLNSDVEFFNSFYDNKFNNIKIKMKHIKKKTYFCDMLIFIDRIKNIIKIKSAKLFRNNFQIYLCEEALK